MTDLTAARVLKTAGKSISILEASSHISGRVTIEEVDSFLLDKGFLVLLTAYPEAIRILDYDAPDLQKFDIGALIPNQDGVTKIGDPIRQQERLRTKS